MMKKFAILGLFMGMATMTAASADAASLTAIYDFRDQLDATTTSFEGLDFTNDGKLWDDYKRAEFTQREKASVER